MAPDLYTVVCQFGKSIVTYPKSVLNALPVVRDQDEKDTSIHLPSISAVTLDRVVHFLSLPTFALQPPLKTSTVARNSTAFAYLDQMYNDDVLELARAAHYLDYEALCSFTTASIALRLNRDSISRHDCWTQLPVDMWPDVDDWLPFSAKAPLLHRAARHEAFVNRIATDYGFNIKDIDRWTGTQLWCMLQDLQTFARLCHQAAWYETTWLICNMSSFYDDADLDLYLLERLGRTSEPNSVQLVECKRNMLRGHYRARQLVTLKTVRHALNYSDEDLDNLLDNTRGGDWKGPCFQELYITLLDEITEVKEADSPLFLRFFTFALQSQQVCQIQPFIARANRLVRLRHVDWEMAETISITVGMDLLTLERKVSRVLDTCSSLEYLKSFFESELPKNAEGKSALQEAIDIDTKDPDVKHFVIGFIWERGWLDAEFLQTLIDEQWMDDSTVVSL